MYEWKLTPEYINDQWTEELLQVMFESRLKRCNKAAGIKTEPNKEKRLSDSDFFRKHGIKPRKV